MPLAYQKSYFDPTTGQLNLAEDLVPAADAAYDIGTIGAKIANLSLGGTFYQYANYVDSSNYQRLRMFVNDISYLLAEKSGTPAEPSFIIGTQGGSLLGFRTNGTNRWYINSTAGHIVPYSDSTYDIGQAANRVRDAYLSGRLLLGSDNTVLLADAANTLAQRDGTNAQTLRLYNTYTSGTDYERLAATWVTNTCYLLTQSAGTGASRALAIGTAGSGHLLFQTNGTTRWYMYGPSGHLYPNTDSLLDIGSPSLAVRDLFADAFYSHNSYAYSGEWERFRAWWNLNIFRLETGAAGAGVQRAMSLNAAALSFQIGGTDEWSINATTLYPSTDVSNSLGSASNRVLDAFIGGTLALGSNDTKLTSDAANMLALRNSTNAQTLAVYGTYVDASNYQRIRIIGGTSSIITVEDLGSPATPTLSVGTQGSAAFYIRTNNINRWAVNEFGHVIPQLNASYDIGSTTNRVRDIHIGSNINAPNLPTSDPAVAGRLWNNSGVVTVSAG